MSHEWASGTLAHSRGHGGGAPLVDRLNSWPVDKGGRREARLTRGSEAQKVAGGHKGHAGKLTRGQGVEAAPGGRWRAAAGRPEVGARLIMHSAIGVCG